MCFTGKNIDNHLIFRAFELHISQILLNTHTHTHTHTIQAYFPRITY
jgi:hypothetical protein